MMKIHEFDIETPPEGLPVWAALDRCPKQPCCDWSVDPASPWVEPDLPRRVGMPGDTIDVQLYFRLMADAPPIPAPHLVRLHFRTPDTEEDRLTDFRWTPAPPRQVPA